MKYLVSAVLILFPIQAFAQGQPLSKSMSQCSGMYFLMHEVAVDRKNKSHQTKAKSAAEKYMQAAYGQAKCEVVSKPYDYVDALVKVSIAQWSKNISDPMKLQENKDWGNYCKALAKDGGLEIFK